jgi:phenylpropionate dioxygenase-like ring-hydroxylating dioxygenase large terminal subunit
MNAPDRRLDIHSLLRLEEGLVHSDVYASPEIFELEMERIFHEGWVYVGHESEIPKRGDYVLRWVGHQSVILNRDDAGKVHVFMNRCRHRASSVCQHEKGNAAFFNCSNHGWTYKSSGELIGVPYPEGAYGPEFRKQDFPLVEPRTDSYRGFVWCNLAPGKTTLKDHLGPIGIKSVDLFCDSSPEGEIVLQQGCLKGLVYGNWKFQGGDGYHPPVTHEASFLGVRAKRKGERNPISGGGRIEDGILSRDLGNGHYCLDTRLAGRGAQLPDTAWARKYREDMVKAYGKERAEYLIRTGGNPHTIFMPNLHLVNSSDLRVIRPIAVDRFEIYFYCPFLKGVPHELNEMRLRDVEDRMGPAGSINPDDVEMFERNQLGMRQTVNPWKYMARGMAREFIDEDLKSPPEYRRSGTLTGHYSDEVTQRAQLRWWAEYLSQPSRAAA